MKHIASHRILVSGESFAACKKQVADFFDRTLLVRYDQVTIKDEACTPGVSPSFLQQIEKGIEENRAIISKLINDLEATGMKSTTDLLQLEHGYPSKVLHIITHFLDGFIGIDTVFYNLVDDSHWMLEKTLRDITTTPDHFWLIHLDGYSATPDTAGLIQ